MPISQFGTDNPGGVDPWPIETSLAQAATGGSAADAANLLTIAAGANVQAGNVYQTNLQQQRQFRCEPIGCKHPAAAPRGCP